MPKYSVEDWIDVQELKGGDFTPSALVLEVAHIFIPDFDDDISAQELRELRIQYTPYIRDTRPTYNAEPIDFKTLNFGQFIDLDMYLTKFKLHEKIKEVANIIYPNHDLEYMEVSDVIGGIQKFINWRENIIKKYKGIFNIAEDDEDEDDEDDGEIIETSEDKWGWLAVVYQLSGGDITKVDAILSKSFISILNWASMRKDFESRQQKPTA